MMVNKAEHKLTGSPDGATLSPAQHRVLWVLGRVYQRLGWISPDAGWVPWYQSCGPRVSRAVAASRSRALARLERRALVRRQPTGRAPHQRTTHVQLTPAGMALARRLTTDIETPDNRDA
jgi:hypothetical protein